MITRLIHVTVLVRDQDEALRFYTEKLGFEKRSDLAFGPGARWLTVAPIGQTDVEIVLQKPDPAMHGEEDARQMTEAIGSGTTWVFACDNCRATYMTLRERGVEFQSEPREEPYGVEAVFVDLYGNPFSLLQPNQPGASDEANETHAAERPETKSELSTALRDGRGQMEAVVAHLGEARMTESGATGGWSVKDVLAHIASGDEWYAGEIERATRGGAPPSAEEIQKMRDDGLFDNETRNRLDYEQYKQMPLADVLAWWRRAHVQLVAAVEAAPDSVLFGPDWWTSGHIIAAVMDVPHEGHHAQELHAWIAQQS
jgi:uncharacterized protein (TIGR03083 family)